MTGPGPACSSIWAMNRRAGTHAPSLTKRTTSLMSGRKGFSTPLRDQTPSRSTSSLTSLRTFTCTPRTNVVLTLRLRLGSGSTGSRFLRWSGANSEGRSRRHRQKKAKIIHNRAGGNNRAMLFPSQNYIFLGRPVSQGEHRSEIQSRFYRSSCQRFGLPQSKLPRSLRQAIQPSI